MILLIYLPFNALFQVFFKYQLNINIFAYLKEILVLAVLALNIFEIIEFKSLTNTWNNFKNRIGNKKIFWLTIAYLVFIILSFTWAESQTYSRLIYGFKYDGFYLVLLLTALLLPAEILNRAKNILVIVFSSNLVALLLGLVFHYLISPENLTFIGYRNDWSTFYTNQSLAFCQKIEHNDLCRFQGTFSGPNQAASNIILFITSGIFLLKEKLKNKTQLIFSLLIGIITLYITFSRSGWLCLLALIILLVINLKSANFKKYFILALSSFLLIGSLTFYFLPETVLRYGSNSDRINLMQHGLELATKNPILGYGIAKSGPASNYIAKPIITENWFLQVAINYGLIGLGLFISIYFLITSSLLKQNNNYKVFAYLMIALLIPLNLLHYFEDSSFSYSLFFILGLIINTLPTQNLKSDLGQN